MLFGEGVWTDVPVTQGWSNTRQSDSQNESLKTSPEQSLHETQDGSLQNSSRNGRYTSSGYSSNSQNGVSGFTEVMSKMKLSKDTDARENADPHIKVMGRLPAVQDAKEKILDVLDTKCNRVTLKMDVSHTEHSHVIGKGGNNIKKVMMETGCHIHFPDSNRNSQMEKSNQVSVAGQAAGAEKARAQIRELLPLVFMFDLPMHNSSQPILPDSSSPHVQHIQQLYNVTVSFKHRPRLCVTQVLVRGTVNNSSAVQEGTSSVIKLYAGSLAASIPVSVTIEIAPQHHVFIMGRAGQVIQAIMQRTGATIHFPDQANVLPPRKSTVYITGHIDNVYMARQLLIGCLPLVLMFDNKDSQEIEPAYLASMMEQLDVFISIKPKPRQNSKSVIVKSTERNAANMFEARRRLLGLDRDPDLPPPCRPDQHMPPLVSPVVPAPGQLYMWQVQQIHNLHNAGPHGLVGSGLGVVSAPLSSGAPVNLSDSPELVQRRLFPATDLNHNHTSTPMKMSPPRKAHGHDADSQTSDGLSSSYEDRLSERSSPTDEFYLSRSSQNTSCSTSGISSGSETLSTNGTDGEGQAGWETLSTNRTGDVLSSRMMSLKVRLSPSDSGSSCDLAAASPQTSSPLRDNASRGAPGSPLRGAPGSPLKKRAGAPPGLVHPSARKPSQLLEENFKKAHLPFCSSDSGSKVTEVLQAELNWDKRAPGSDRPSVPALGEPPGMDHGPPGMDQAGLAGALGGDHAMAFLKSFTDEQELNAAFNYEEKKMLATRAMRKKPEGESRFPTDYWAGLGFSKSMPDQAIRERLKAINARFRDQQNSSDVISEGLEGCDSESESSSLLSHDLLASSSKQGCGLVGPGRHHADWSPSSSGSSCRSLHSRLTTLPDLFSELGLDKYAHKFVEQEIDLATFLTLSEHDLKELGITKFGARRKMLLAIADINKKQQQQQQQASTTSLERTPPRSGCPASPEATPTSHAPPTSGGPLPFFDNSLFSRPHGQFVSLSGRW